MIDILISGFYGFSNSGDEAVLQSIVELLKTNKPEITIGALTQNGKSIYVRGIQSVNRTNLFQIIRIMKKSKLFISGGGSLIQDVTSSRSLYYYLGLILLAKMMGTKVMLYANGIGPVNGSFNRWLSRRIVNKVDLITLRETDSQHELKAMGITKPPCYVTADPAIEIPPIGDQEIAALKKKIGMDPAKNTVCLSIRKWGKYTDKMVDILARTADRLIEDSGVQILLLPLHFSNDYKICDRLRNTMKHNCILPDKDYRVPEILGLMKGSQAVIGMRLHSLIYAASLNVPVVGIVYDTKVKGFLNYIGQPFMETVEEIQFESLFEKITYVIQQRGAITQELDKRMAELRKLTKKDAEMAIGFLE